MNEQDEISNVECILDSRDIIARIEFLSGRTNDPEEMEAWGELDESEKVELANLKALADEGANSAEDWEFGVTLIHDDYFVEYSREIAFEIEVVSRDEEWPLNCIDWEQAAEALKVDYSPVEFDGETYWVR